MAKPPVIGTHLAALNLFREGPHHCEITVADARGAIAEMTPHERGETAPADYLEPLIIAAADRMRVRCGLAIPLMLHCPRCGTQHIDEPAPGWDNPPHRSHACQKPGCLCVWRPADVPTTGVAASTTAGKADNWAPGDTIVADRP